MFRNFWEKVWKAWTFILKQFFVFFFFWGDCLYFMCVCTPVYRVVILLFSLLSCVWLFCDPMDCSPPGSSVHGIFQASILEWIAIPFSRGSSWPRDRTWVSCKSSVTHLFLLQVQLWFWCGKRSFLGLVVFGWGSFQICSAWRRSSQAFWYHCDSIPASPGPALPPLGWAWLSFAGFSGACLSCRSCSICRFCSLL